MRQLVDLTLPAFAFVYSGHDGRELDGRNVVLHVRSASVIEMLPREDLVMTMSDDILTYEFSFVNYLGLEEHHVALLHYCATLDARADRDTIMEEIIKPAEEWFALYCLWEDSEHDPLGDEI